MATGPLKMLIDGLQGRHCKVTKRDFDWNFNFGEELNINATSPWRIVTPAGELRLGVVTALLGTPFFLWLVVKSRRELEP